MQKSTASFWKPLQSKKIDHELSQRLVYANQQVAVIVPPILLTSCFNNVFTCKHLYSNACVHDGFDIYSQCTILQSNDVKKKSLEGPNIVFFLSLSLPCLIIPVSSPSYGSCQKHSTAWLLVPEALLKDNVESIRPTPLLDQTLDKGSLVLEVPLLLVHVLHFSYHMFQSGQIL
jgi:hypothetical protein